MKQSMCLLVGMFHDGMYLLVVNIFKFLSIY
jgi:hypothetical protein